MNANQDHQDADFESANKTICDLLATIGSLYKIKGDTYRARAYLNASSSISFYPDPITSGKQAKKIKGVGKSIADNIDEYFSTGKIQRLVDLQNDLSSQKKVIDLFTSVFGIGPVAATKFYSQGYKTLTDLVNSGQLNRSQLAGIKWKDQIDQRILRDEIDILENLLFEIFEPQQLTWQIAGSYRRKEASSGDVDLLIRKDPGVTVDSIVSCLKPIIVETLARGHSKFMGVYKLSEEHTAHRLDILVIDPESFPYALFYFTGSQKFNVLVRTHSKEKGYSTLNEHGLYDKRGKFVPAKSEKDIFKILGIKYVSPEDRTREISSLELC